MSRRYTRVSKLQVTNRARDAQSGEERQGLLGMCLHYLCSPCGYRTRTVLLGALSHFGRTGGAGSDLPGPWLARCDRWWYSGWEILLQAAGVSSFILRMLLLTS